jgi:hypothetical protein
MRPLRVVIATLSPSILRSVDIEATLRRRPWLARSRTIEGVIRVADPTASEELLAAHRQLVFPESKR